MWAIIATANGTTIVIATFRYYEEAEKWIKSSYLKYSAFKIVPLREKQEYASNDNA